MDGMLSQDEINALLSGMDLGNISGDASDAPQEAASADSVPESPAIPEPVMDSQSVDDDAAWMDPDHTLLNDIERDAIGEVANISMGSSATTLYSLVNRKVNITTPVVSLANWKTMIAEYEKPSFIWALKSKRKYNELKKILDNNTFYIVDFPYKFL